MKVTLLAHTSEPEKVVAAAAKLCYSQKADIDSLMESLTPDAIEKFVSKLESYGHGSPFEHASFTFAIEGVDRAFMAQATRHRVGTSFSIRSQRYCSEANFDTVMPKAIEKNDKARIAYRSLMADVKKVYNDMQNEGIANEDARAVLPNSCETRMIVTMNVRQLWHYFNERCCMRAQAPHRAVANEMLRLCKEAAPVLFRHAGPKCVKGYCPEGAMTCGKAPTMDELQKAYRLVKWDKSLGEKAGA